MSIKNDYIKPNPANGKKKNGYTFLSGNHNPFFQPKLTIGPTDDIYEREADAVADQVMRMSEKNDQHFFSSQPIAIKPLVQTKCAACEEEEQLQRKEDELEEENVVFRMAITSLSGADDDRVNNATIQRQETPSETSGSEEKSPESLPDPGINWFEMSRPFLTRGAGNLLYDPSAYGSISQQWNYNYNLFNVFGLGTELSKEASNFVTPFAIDSALKRDFPLPWEIMDRELNTSTIMISPTIFNFDIGNLKKSFTMPSPFRSVFGLPENPYNIQRKCEEFEDEGKAIIQKKDTDEERSSGIESVEKALQSPGKPIEDSERSLMEERFGYDFSNVKIHTDSLAATSAQSISALAYTSGNNIVFNEGQYSPGTPSGERLLAHELAHVIQQDAATSGRIQRATLNTNGGEWRDENYSTGVSGIRHSVTIDIKFKPQSNVNATKIGLVQAVNSIKNGRPYQINNNATIRGRSISAADSIVTNSVTGETDAGFHIDRLSDRNNPIYGTASLPAGRGLESSAEGPNNTFGRRFIDPGGVLQQKDATLHDSTGLNNASINSGQIFETTAFAFDGVQKGMFYGSVRWGWRTNASGNLTQIPFSVASQGVPTSTFIKSTELWNSSTTSGGGATVDLRAVDVQLTNVANINLNQFMPGGLPARLLPLGTRVHIMRASSPDPALAGKVFVRVVDGPHVGRDGWIHRASLSDERP